MAFTMFPTVTGLARGSTTWWSRGLSAAVPTPGAVAPLASQPSAVQRTPFYFGPASRPLFGWYHEPIAKAHRAFSMLISPPLGHEYINSHRALRHLADRSAAAGVP